MHAGGYDRVSKGRAAASAPEIRKRWPECLSIQGEGARGRSQARGEDSPHHQRSIPVFVYLPANLMVSQNHGDAPKLGTALCKWRVAASGLIPRFARACGRFDANLG